MKAAQGGVGGKEFLFNGYRVYAGDSEKVFSIDSGDGHTVL